MTATQSRSDSPSPLPPAPIPVPADVIEGVARRAGYRVHFGDAEQFANNPACLGKFWWTLGRDGWSGYEVSEGEFTTANEAWVDALRHHAADEEVVVLDASSIPDPVTL